MDLYEAEKRLLEDIQSLGSRDIRVKIENQLHAKHNTYDFRTYLDNLASAKRMLLNKIKDADLIINSIKLNIDFYI